jgi:hypothetical protein
MKSFKEMFINPNGIDLSDFNIIVKAEDQPKEIVKEEVVVVPPAPQVITPIINVIAEKGERGIGTEGKRGKAATIKINEVNSGPAPLVENIGTEHDLLLNITLPEGKRGLRGGKGDKGESIKGDKGDNGLAGKIKINEVISGDRPAVINVGNEHEAVLNFVIPKGQPGEAATIKIGQVTTGPVPLVENSGTPEHAVLNFTLPLPKDGKDGENGEDGKAATIEIVEVVSGVIPMVENIGTPEHAKLRIVLEKGRDGKDGKDGKDGIGKRGISGRRGQEGKKGEAATIRVGRVHLGESAQITNIGTMNEAILDFTFPTPKDGKDGKTPVKGVDYFDGKDGITPVKGVDYFDGKDGKDGEKGERGPVPKHEAYKNRVRFELPDGSFGPWLDLGKGVIQASHNNYFGGGGDTLDFFYKGNLYRGKRYIKFDENSLELSEDLNDIYTVTLKAKATQSGTNVEFVQENFDIDPAQYEYNLQFDVMQDSLVVALNGVLLTEGVDRDYVLHNNTAIRLNSEYKLKSYFKLYVKYVKAPI